MRKTNETQQFKFDMVMEYVEKRIQDLAKKISDNKLSNEFGNVTSIHFTNGSDGGFSIMGSFLFDTYLFDSIASAAECAFQGVDMVEDIVASAEFNNVAVVAMDAYSMMEDDGTKIHSIKYNGGRAYYPKGRNKKCAIDPKLIANFNRAANQNYAMPGGNEAELSALIEVMRNMEALMAFKVREITVEKGESLAGAIKKLAKNGKKNGGLDLMVGGLRTAI